MTTRLATQEEADAIFKMDGAEVVVILVDDDGIKGHLCLSRSPYGVFGHNTTFETPSQALALWRAAKRKLKEWDVSEFFVHLEVGTPKRLRDFWLRHSEPVFVVLKGEI